MFTKAPKLVMLRGNNCPFLLAMGQQSLERKRRRPGSGLREPHPARAGAGF